MSSPPQLTAGDIVLKSVASTLATALGIALIALGWMYEAPAFYAISVVLASTAVFYLQHTRTRDYVLGAAVIALLLVLAGYDQTVLIAVVSFLAVFVLAYASRSAKFFWEQ